MPAANGSAHHANAEVAELWRSWLIETERQWNGFFAEVLGTDSFAQFVGNYMEGYSLIQRYLNRGMERYLNTFNLPTHADITELGERLHNIEERLASIESNVRNLTEAAGLTASIPVTQIRPRRTRRPQTKDGAAG